jgi:membrane protease YdiL (CAAX protease family)
VNRTLQTTAGRITTAAALAVLWAVIDRRSSHDGLGASQPARLGAIGGPPARRRTIAGAVLSATGPAAVLVVRLRHRSIRCAPPPSLLGRLLLITHVAAGAAAEELLFRRVATVPMPRGRRWAVAGSSVTVFGLAHLRRDGVRECIVHVVNALAWTAAAWLSGSVRWSVLSHSAYNLLGYILAGGPEPQDPERTAPVVPLDRG